MEHLLSEKAVLRLLSIGRTTLWRKVRRGYFPPPREVSTGRKAWLASEVDECIAQLPVAQQYTDCKYEPLTVVTED